MNETTPSTKRRILVTGPSGVIGRALVEALSQHHVTGLVHVDTELPDVTEVIHGDLAKPQFGLTTSRWHELAERVDVVVHSGALTTWGKSRSRYQEINIDGTARVLEFARRAGAPVHYLSTCFVHGIERTGLSDVAQDNVVRPYVWSKLEAERLIAASGVPYAVYRPTNLVGDSRTGASSRRQIVQVMSEFICRGKAPYLPAHPGNLLDFVPLDVTVDAVVRTLEADDLRGQIEWLTYGADAMTVAQARDILTEHAASLGRPLGDLRIVDPRRRLPVPLSELPPLTRSFLKVLIDVSEMTHAAGGVLPSSKTELRERLGVDFPSDRDAYRSSLKFWANETAVARTAER
ncbi:SDR family oxidoreductase [Nocardia brasiliensis]|uniref:SDR family oxidoreductase n=1 Tax=Nocardia brasiliensis TaxID=37326 RepID=UPI002454B31F|nr:SDR family oxidoreductase [Nocardia brasiliensis]